jgi:hypothetical protein
MRIRRRRNSRWPARSAQDLLVRRFEAPPDAQTRREQAREAFFDARDALRIVLEDEIEAEARAECPAATDLDVEVYNDELGEPRGRLISVNTDAGTADDQHDAIAERIAELLDEWAVVADVDSTEIVFRPLPDQR